MSEQMTDDELDTALSENDLRTVDSDIAFAERCLGLIADRGGFWESDQTEWLLAVEARASLQMARSLLRPNRSVAEAA